jgi:hypothetical protein
MRLPAVVFVGLLFAIDPLFAQQKPDFSGHWVMVSPVEGAGQEQVVTQDATTLKVAPAAGGPGPTLVYRLDGTEGRTVLTGDGSGVMISKAAWKGTQLKIANTVTTSDGQTLNQTLVWSLDGEGRLVIEVQLARPGAPPTNTTMVYRKQ